MATIKALLRAAMRTAMAGAFGAIFGGALVRMFLASPAVVLKTAIDCGLFASFAYMRQNHDLAEAVARIRGRKKKEKSPAG